MAQSQRLEDLGRIREKITHLLLHHPWLESINSKHDWTQFKEKYSNEDNLLDLFQYIRSLKDQLDDIHSLSIGYE